MTPETEATIVWCPVCAKARFGYTGEPCPGCGGETQAAEAVITGQARDLSALRKALEEAEKGLRAAEKLEAQLTAQAKELDTLRGRVREEVRMRDVAERVREEVIALREYLKKFLEGSRESEARHTAYQSAATQELKELRATVGLMHRGLSKRIGAVDKHIDGAQQGLSRQIEVLDGAHQAVSKQIAVVDEHVAGVRKAVFVKPPEKVGWLRGILGGARK